MVHTKQNLNFEFESSIKFKFKTLTTWFALVFWLNCKLSVLIMVSVTWGVTFVVSVYRSCFIFLLFFLCAWSRWSLSCLSVTATFLIDVDINISDTSTPTHNQISGPITQARPRQLNNQISSFLASYSSYLDNGNMCSILLLRNDGQEGNRVAFMPVTFGFQNSNSLWRSPRSRMDLDSGMQILSGKLLESKFICIKPQVHIMSEPAAIVILVQRHFAVNDAATPYFWPIGPCIMLSSIQTRPRVGARPNLPEVVLPHL
jgi:hypothetical protein